MLPLRARVDLGAMAMNDYSTFPKSPALLKPDHQIILCHIQDTRWEAVSVFCSLSQLGQLLFAYKDGYWHNGQSAHQWPGKTLVQSQVESYKRLKKWYLIHPCFTHTIIRYKSRQKWVNPGKEYCCPLHLGVVVVDKGAFGLPLITVANNFTKMDLTLNNPRRLICR